MASNEASVASVRTSFEYQTSVGPGFFYMSAPDDSTYKTEVFEVTATNARPREQEFTLDAHGFTLRRFKTEVTDFGDEAQIKAYHAEVEAILREVIGAQKVLIFDTKRRNLAADGWGNLPSRIAHIDFTPRSYEHFAREMLGDEAEHWLKRRWLGLNVWRPERLVESDHLALCDASSVAPDDLVECKVAFAPGDDPLPVSGLNLRHSPDHKWYYFPKMTRDEVLLVKIQDSDRSKALSSPHVAIADPTAPADALPRASIELRTLAFL